MSHETTNPGPPVANFAIQAAHADEWARRKFVRDELFKQANETADQIRELQSRHNSLVSRYVRAECELRAFVGEN